MIEDEVTLDRESHRSTRPARRIPLAIGVAGVVSECVEGYLHPAVGAALAIANGAASLVTVLTIIGAVLFGTDKTCERIFRLLRWLANRPEPPSPAGTVTAGVARPG